jgi:hypothetical protein
MVHSLWRHGVWLSGTSVTNWSGILGIVLLGLGLLIVLSWVLDNRRGSIVAVHEAHVDVIDEGRESRLVAELPGVREEDIKVAVQDETVILDTTGERRYRAVVDLAEPVDAASLRRVYTNGLLELWLQKA